MNELLVGYARVSTEQQDLTSQRNGLHALGVGDDRIYVDHGLTGANRDRPGLRLALAACRAGDTLVVTKLDRLTRSLPDARDILDELTKRNVKLSLGGSIHDPTDPVGRLLFNVLAMVAEFESDLIRLRTREGMKVAKAKGRLRGKQPKLKPNQAKHLPELHDAGNTQPIRTRRTVQRRAIHDLSDHRADPTQATRSGAAIRASCAARIKRRPPADSELHERSPIVMSWPTRRCRRSATTRRLEAEFGSWGPGDGRPREQCLYLGRRGLTGARPSRAERLGVSKRSMRPLVSSVFVLMPGLLRRSWSGAGAGRCPWSA